MKNCHDTIAVELKRGFIFLFFIIPLTFIQNVMMYSYGFCAIYNWEYMYIYSLWFKNICPRAYHTFLLLFIIFILLNLPVTLLQLNACTMEWVWRLVTQCSRLLSRMTSVFVYVYIFYFLTVYLITMS